VEFGLQTLLVSVVCVVCEPPALPPTLPTPTLGTGVYLTGHRVGSGRLDNHLMSAFRARVLRVMLVLPEPTMGQANNADCEEEVCVQFS